MNEIRSEIAIRGSQELTAASVETDVTRTDVHRGMRVLTAEEYKNNYRTDVRSHSEDSLTTFNFTGYVRGYDPDNPESLIYRDVIATNGLLADETQRGIHIGIDGVIDYNRITGNHRMTGPEQVTEYDMYVTIPAELQKLHNCYCIFDSCRAVPENPEDYVTDDIERAYEQEEGYIVIRLSLDPGEVPAAREKVLFLNDRLVQFVADGGRLEEIEDFVRDLQDELLELDEAASQEFQVALARNGKPISLPAADQLKLEE